MIELAIGYTLKLVINFIRLQENNVLYVHYLYENYKLSKDVYHSVGLGSKI
jgi:hypothetical protein